MIENAVLLVVVALEGCVVVVNDDENGFVSSNNDCRCLSHHYRNQPKSGLSQFSRKHVNVYMVQPAIHHHPCRRCHQYRYYCPCQQSDWNFRISG